MREGSCETLPRDLSLMGVRSAGRRPSLRYLNRKRLVRVQIRQPVYFLVLQQKLSGGTSIVRLSPLINSTLEFVRLK